MKRSKLIRVSSLVVAIVVLTGALAVAAYSGSPYETLKKAVFDAMTYSNVTMEAEANLAMNGVSTANDYTYTVTGDNGSMTRNSNSGNDESNFRYQTDEFSIYPTYTAVNGKEWYGANIYQANSGNMYSNSSSIFGVTMDPENRNTAQFRFMELLLDALVGDIKNNITMSSDNGIRKISGTLTDSQLPALAKAGIDVLIEEKGGNSWSEREISFDGTTRTYEQSRISKSEAEITVYRQTLRPMSKDEYESQSEGIYINDGEFYGTWFDNDTNIQYIITDNEVVRTNRRQATRDDFNFSDPFNVPMKSLILDYIHGDAEVDADGNLLSINVDASVTVTNIFGDVNVLDIQYNVRFSDIGISNAACPFPGAESLLTSEAMKKRFGNQNDSNNMNVYFTLNPDGSIDESSITTMWPGEREMTPYTTYEVNTEDETDNEDED